jgi:UPF0755 protein
MSGKLRRSLAWLALAGLIAVVALAGSLYRYAHVPLPLDSLPREFELKSGSGLRSIARQMVQEGVLSEPWRFTLMARVLGKAGEIKAGSYEIVRALTPLELLEKVTSGDVIQEQLTFPEGWTFLQWRRALSEQPKLRHDSQPLSERELLDRLGATGYGSAEGWFYPDTYRFTRGASDLYLLQQAHDRMKKQLDRLWNARAPDLPFKTPYEALILASIVEKETGLEADRPLVAAVFVNRLQRGMKLQTDPTVIYGMGAAFDGNLRKEDLQRDTPFNTYARDGLPPTPICMPGLASLAATLNPPKSDALYFVARGDGSSHFSRSLAEHNRAVARYQGGKR